MIIPGKGRTNWLFEVNEVSEFVEQINLEDNFILHMGSHFNSDIGVENVKIEYVRYFCVILMQDNINFPIFLWYNVFFPKYWNNL